MGGTGCGIAFQNEINFQYQSINNSEHLSLREHEILPFGIP